MTIPRIRIAGLCLLFFVTPAATQAESIDPLVVLRSFFDVEHAGNVDAALAHWADDGMFVNTRGKKLIGREQLRTFIQNAVNAKVHHEMKSPRVEGGRVTWFQDESTDFYQKLGIQSVQIVSDAVVQGGKIKTLVSHFPASEIGRISQACKTPNAGPFHVRPELHRLRSARPSAHGEP